MTANPWMKFYPRDWRGDQALRACSVAARGLWMECLCIMHEAKPYGHLLLNGNPVGDDTLARMAGISVDEAQSLMAELRQAGVFSLTREGVVFSRRMTKDFGKAQKGAKWAKKRWSQVAENSAKSGGPNGSPNGPPSTQKPEARDQRESSTATSEQEAPREPVPIASAARRWTRSEIDRIEAACREAASIDGLSPCWLECSAIIGLIEAGYDLEADILPSIRAQTQRLGKPAGSPKYYVAGIREAAAGRKRLAGERKPGAGPDDDEWRKRLRLWRDRGLWSDKPGWGPRPDKPDCIVPRHILAEFTPPAAANG